MRIKKRVAMDCPARWKVRGFQGLALAAFTGFPLLAWAFGVGDAELHSGYAQPLSARIPITLTDADHVVQASELSVRLLPFSSYEAMGLTPPPLNPEAVKLEVSGSGQAYWVELKSEQRIREPFMTLLLEVRLAGVRIIRELPVLFDLPASKPAPVIAAPAPVVVAAVTAVPPVESSIEAIALPAPSETAPVALIEPVSVAPATPARAIIRRSPKPARTVRKPVAESPKLSTFKLAGWNQTGLAPAALMPRFQLAQQFESYRQLVEAGTPPVPETLAQAQGAASETQVANDADAAPAVSAAPAVRTGWGSLWWLLIAALAYPAAIVLQRWRKQRNAGEAVSDTSLGKVIAVPATIVVEKAPADAVQIPTPTPIPAPAVVEAPPPSAEVVIAQPVQAATPPPALPVPPAVPQDDLRKRLAEMMDRAGSDATLLRKLQLVSAYMDLNRLESAELLLKELETEANAGARPKFTLIKG